MSEEDEASLRQPDEIHPHELESALAALAFMDDPYLRMQVTNLTVTDQALMGLESQVLHRLIDEERTPLDDALLLQAFSQMWIFAAYELLRTWRQRVKEFDKLKQAGGIDFKVKALASRGAKLHPVRDIRIEQLRKVRDDDKVIEKARDDLRRTHIQFRLLESLRVVLAKHEFSGKKNALPHAPGYGRINRYTGSLEFEISMDHIILEVVSRRDIADGIRAFADSGPLPDDAALRSFDDFMSGAGMPSAPDIDGEGDTPPTE